MHAKLACLAVLTSMTMGLCAREYAPRVVGPNRADGYSAKTFAEFARWKDLSADAKMWEIYKYLADKRTGVYPLGMPNKEGRDPFYEAEVVRDPIKALNTHVGGYCDAFGPTWSGLLKDMGMGEARTIDYPGVHVVGEVFFDNAWHYLDLDARAAFHREDGKMLSLAEALKDDSIWKKSDLMMPLGDPAKARISYGKTRVEYRHGVNQSGHTMDYVLRRGETFTRWWNPQGGRFHYSGFAQNKVLMGIVDREPRGIKCKHQGWSVWTQGNGRFIYQPNLSESSKDFADGIYDFENVKPGPKGLTLERDGEGYAIFEFRTPYIIVPIVGDISATEDDREAALMELDGTSAKASVSMDNGKTWTEAPEGSTPLDLTKFVAGQYGYLLKLALKDKSGETVVRGLKVTTWVQVNPASLPALSQGKNLMQYKTGDHYGLQTRVMEIRSNGNVQEEFMKYVSDPPKNFDPKRRTARAIGPFTVEVSPPPGSEIVWINAGGAFNTVQRAGAKNTNNTMAYAANEPKDFKEIYKADIPDWQSHWHYNANREVKLESNAAKVYVQYVGDPGCNNYFVYAHCVDTPEIRGVKRPCQAPVKITHAWKENGELKSKQVNLNGSAGYEIETAAVPADEYIEIEIPSDWEKQ